MSSSPSSNALQNIAARRAFLHAATLVDAASQCPHCFGIKSPNYATCHGCGFLDVAPWGRAAAWYGTIVVKGSALYWDFNNYKRFGPATLGESWQRVTSLLSLATWTHAEAIATHLGGEPTIVCPVPSSRGMTVEAQPLTVAIQHCALMKHHFVPALRAHPTLRRDKGLFQPEYFVPARDVRGERIVLVEDLTASGRTAYSAWYALRSAGAQVAMLSIARLMSPDFRNADDVLARLPRPAWFDHIPPE
ncbi:MAG: phosphoribosyltransferase [Gemmatimonadaceae bacterium]|nr:phosphoribosyltransferase [Gemmatimonadaceae bacterium]